MRHFKQTTTVLGPGGRVVIPASFRKALGMAPGDTVVLMLEDGEVRLLTAQQAIKRAQSLVRAYVPRKRNLADELINERNTEVRRG